MERDGSKKKSQTCEQVIELNEKLRYRKLKGIPRILKHVCVQLTGLPAVVTSTQHSFFFARQSSVVKRNAAQKQAQLSSSRKRFGQLNVDRTENSM